MKNIKRLLLGLIVLALVVFINGININIINTASADNRISYDLYDKSHKYFIIVENKDFLRINYDEVIDMGLSLGSDKNKYWLWDKKLKDNPFHSINGYTYNTQGTCGLWLGLLKEYRYNNSDDLLNKLKCTDKLFNLYY